MTPEQRIVWLAERRKGIGGSDAAAAVGLSKWKTPLELYLDKRGEFHQEETEAMRWGTILEPVVRQEYANRTGRTVEVPGKILRHPTFAFALVNLDGIADGTRLYEGKTSRTAEGWGEAGSDEIPIDPMMQVQHGMAVAGLAVADVAVLIGSSDFRIYVVPADAELQAMLLEQEAAFWQRVIEGNPPDPVNRDDVKLRWQRSNGGTAKATAEVLAIAQRLAVVKELRKAAEAQEDDLAADIQRFMQGTAALEYDSDTIATWNNINAAPRFDMKRFQEEQPEIWKQYLREPGPQRRFLLKPKSPALLRPRVSEASQRLIALGAVLNNESDAGSMYFDLPDGSSVRLADHDPNDKTLAWMMRRGVHSVRVDEPGWREQLAAIFTDSTLLIS